MAYGDGTLATAAGIPVCVGTVAANTIDTEITKTRDYVGEMKANLPRKVTVGTVAPSTGTAAFDIFVKIA